MQAFTNNLLKSISSTEVRIELQSSLYKKKIFTFTKTIIQIDGALKRTLSSGKSEIYMASFVVVIISDSLDECT